MADYRVGIEIFLAGAVERQLALLSTRMLGLHTTAGEVTREFNRWSLAIGGVAAIIGGSAIIGGIVKLGEHGKEVNHQLELMKIKGMEFGEIQQANAKAIEVTGSVLTTTYAENLKHIQELRYAFGGTETALKYLEVVSKANAVLNAVRAKTGGIGGGGAVDEVFELVKSLEQKGETVDPDAFMRYVDIMTKVVNVTMGKVTPAQFQSTFKYGRTAMLGWDEEFIGQILPRLIQSMQAGKGGAGGAGGPGNALMTGFRQIVSGTMSKPAAQLFQDLGLATMHPAHGTTKAFTSVNDELVKMFIANPYEAMQQFIMPALVAKFGRDQDALIKQLGILFPVRTWGSLGAEMGLQGRYFLGAEKSPFEKDRRLTQMAMGLGAYEDLIERDPTIVLMAFHAQMKNLGEALGKPVWAPGGVAMQALSRLTVIINAMARFAAAHPEGVERMLAALAVLGGSLIVGGIVAIAAALGGLALAAGGIAAAAIAIGALVALNWSNITAFFDRFGGLPKLFGAMGSAIYEAAAGGIAMAGVTIGNYVASTFGSAIWQGLNAAISFVNSGINDLLKQMSTAILDGLNAIVAGIRGIFSGPAGVPGGSITVPQIPGGTPPGGVIETPGGAGMTGPHTGKRSYNAVPPPAGGSQYAGGGDVYLDGRKIGDILAGVQARSMGGPLQGSAYFDGTQSSPASDLSLSYG